MCLNKLLLDLIKSEPKRILTNLKSFILINSINLLVNNDINSLELFVWEINDLSISISLSIIETFISILLIDFNKGFNKLIWSSVNLLFESMNWFSINKLFKTSLKITKLSTKISKIPFNKSFVYSFCSLKKLDS